MAGFLLEFIKRLEVLIKDNEKIIILGFLFILYIEAYCLTASIYTCTGTSYVAPMY